MDDRVRIYELARKMNVPNQDIINTLRELGYDIKSHSSTVDKIGQDKVIAAFAKKKQQPDGAEKGKMAKTTPQPGKATTVKAAAAPPPPQPAAVKPRVLSRYRPERPNADGTIPQPHFLPIGDAAGSSAAHAAPSSTTVAQSTDKPSAVQPAATSPSAQTAQTAQPVQPAQTSQGQPLPATIAPAQTVTAPREEAQPVSHTPVTNGNTAGTATSTETVSEPEASSKAAKSQTEAAQEKTDTAVVEKEADSTEKALTLNLRLLKPKTMKSKNYQLCSLAPLATVVRLSKFAPRVIRKLDAKKLSK
jgi:translation initiation factor IF-2